MSADLMMSCSTFFNEHQRSMGQAAAHQLGMSQKDGSGGRYSSPDRRGRGGDNDEDFGR